MPEIRSAGDNGARRCEVVKAFRVCCGSTARTFVVAGLLVTEEVPLAVLGAFLTNFELPVLLPEVLAAQVGCSCGAVALNLIQC